MRKWGCHSFEGGNMHAIFPVYATTIMDRLEAAFFILTDKSADGFVYDSRVRPSKRLDTMILTEMSDYGIMRGNKWRETHKRECQDILDGLKVKAYVLAPAMYPTDTLEIVLERIMIDGMSDDVWVIRSWQSFLGKDMKWHPKFSSDDDKDDFIMDCTFRRIETAIETWDMFLNTDLGKQWRGYELNHISDIRRDLNK